MLVFTLEFVAGNKTKDMLKSFLCFVLSLSCVECSVWVKELEAPVVKEDAGISSLYDISSVINLKTNDRETFSQVLTFIKVLTATAVTFVMCNIC